MIKLNKEQVKQLAEFVSNLGLVFAALMVTPLFSGKESVNIIVVSAGLVSTVLCILVSLLILGKKDT